VNSLPLVSNTPPPKLHRGLANGKTCMEGRVGGKGGDLQLVMRKRVRKIMKRYQKNLEGVASNPTEHKPVRRNQMVDILMCLVPRQGYNSSVG
jgi:hypothetical protein